MTLAHTGSEVTEEKVRRLADFAGHVAATFPPLTPEQRSRLAVLLRPIPSSDDEEERS